MACASKFKPAWIQYWARIAASLLILCLPAAQAHADIASFNAAMKTGDYKTAAREAADTWPTLDKSRDDIGLIAHEFAFASYIAGEYEAARDLARFATENPAPGPDQSANELISSILANAASLRLDDKKADRNRLFDALTERAKIDGFDLVSILAAEALLSYDFDKHDWRKAEASAKLVAPIAAAGGPAYLARTREYELLAIAAASNRDPTGDTLQAFHDLRLKVISDMDTMVDEEIAANLVPVYWAATAWHSATYAYLWSSDRVQTKTGSIIGRRGPSREEFCDCDPDDIDMPDRVAQLLEVTPYNDTCELKLTVEPPIRFPTSARMNGSIGAVIVKVDVDSQGQASNGRLMSAVPQKYFADSVLDHISDISYAPGDNWDSQVCELARKNRVILFSFTFGG